MLRADVTSRTIVDSVTRVDGPPSDLPLVEARLDALRERFAGAILSRYLEGIPRVGDRVFIAPGAAIVGSVELGDDTSVWFGCVLRGDVNRIEIRERSNVQDGTVVHVGDSDPTFIGEEVVIGHRAVVHGCRLGGGCLVGIGAIVMDGARVGEGSVLGAGTLVTAGTEIPPHSLVLGMPGKVVRTLTSADETFHRALAGKYVRLAHNHRVG
jgi:carbonic anhydrase/acetyltransferase-like protein (isoleucine patch superfamily)